MWIVTLMCLVNGNPKTRRLVKQITLVDCEGKKSTESLPDSLRRAASELEYMQGIDGPEGVGMLESLIGINVIEVQDES